MLFPHLSPFMDAITSFYGTATYPLHADYEILNGMYETAISIYSLCILGRPLNSRTQLEQNTIPLRRILEKFETRIWHLISYASMPFLANTTHSTHLQIYIHSPNIAASAGFHIHRYLLQWGIASMHLPKRRLARCNLSCLHIFYIYIKKKLCL